MSDPFLGEIKMVGFNFAPNGYAFCNGAVLAISTNTALFSLLGTTYGGNGVNTFALPNYCSRSPVGMGQGPGLSLINQGEMSGVENTTILQTQMPAHTHVPDLAASISIPANTANGSSQSPSSTSVLSTTADNEVGAKVNLYSAGPGSTTLAPFNAPITGQVGVAGGSQPLPIRNPYLGTNFIIALQGVFPSRS